MAQIKVYQKAFNIIQSNHINDTQIHKVFKTCVAQFASCVNPKTVQILNNHKHKIKIGKCVYCNRKNIS